MRLVEVMALSSDVALVLAEGGWRLTDGWRFTEPYGSFEEAMADTSTIRRLTFGEDLDDGEEE